MVRILGFDAIDRSGSPPKVISLQSSRDLPLGPQGISSSGPARDPADNFGEMSDQEFSHVMGNNVEKQPLFPARKLLRVLQPYLEVNLNSLNVIILAAFMSAFNSPAIFVSSSVHGRGGTHLPLKIDSTIIPAPSRIVVISNRSLQRFPTLCV